MVELTYIGADVTVPINNAVPFNNVLKSGCAERYTPGGNKITLVKPGRYLVTVSANVAVPTGATVGPVSLAIAADGDTEVGTVMISTPAAVEEFNNVSTQTYIDVYPCCCVSVTLKNVGAVDALVNNQNITAVRVNGCGGV